MYYYCPKTPVQKGYYEYHQSNGRGAKPFGFLPESVSEFDRDYRLLRNLHSRLHPYWFVESNDTVIQIGAHDGFIKLGYSNVFILSSIVEDGGVITIECDPRNVENIEDYAERNEVSNVRCIERGVWNEPDTLTFTFFDDYSSSNTISDVLEERNLDEYWERERVQEYAREVEADVDTLDNLSEEYPRIGDADIINLTTNGAEPQGIEGATSLLEQGGVRAVAFPFRSSSFEVSEFLQERGFSIALADAPTKAWESKTFLYAVATRRPVAQLKERGFAPAEVSVSAKTEHDQVEVNLLNDKKGS